MSGAEDGDLTAAVRSAVEWATGESGAAQVLAELALALAREIDGAPNVVLEKPPPVAQLAKELRATLEDLEDLRGSDGTQSELASVLSSPVWDASESGSPDAGAARRKGGRKSG